MWRVSAALTPLQLAFRGGEAFLPVLLAWQFGSDGRTDAFYTVWSVATFLGAFLLALYRDSALIPVLAACRRQQPEVMPALRGRLLLEATVAGAGLGVLLLAGLSLPVINPAGVSVIQAAPLALYLVAFGARSALSAFLQSERRFVSSALSGGVGMLIALAFVALFRGQHGIWLVGWALATGELLALVLAALGTMATLPVSFAPQAAARAASRTFRRHALVESAGRFLTRVNPVVDQSLAMAAGFVGGATALRLSADVAGVPTGILQATLLPVLITELAEIYAAEGAARHRQQTLRAAIIVALALSALCGFIYLFRWPLVRLVFQHGQMTGEDVEALLQLIPYRLAGIPAFGVMLVLARAITACGAGRILAIFGALNVATHVGLDLALLPSLGVRGLALAGSLVNFAMAGFLYWRLSGIWRAGPVLRAGQCPGFRQARAGGER
jgi:putative peptidoglycan lipid II flippase